jgi:Heterokaryon incompatibility protein (HET)
MHLIYKHAHQVTAWLGLACLNSNLAFEFAEKLYDCFPHEARRGTEGELEERGSQFPDVFLNASTSHLIHADHAREWLALHNLFKREYWGRAWVFQEIVMAKRLIFVCGLKSSTWGIIGLATRITRYTSSQVRDPINSSGPIKDQDTLYPVSQENPHTFANIYQQRLLGVFEGRNYMKNYFRGASTSQTFERWLELI